MNNSKKYFQKRIIYSGIALLFVIGCKSYNGSLPNLIVNGSAELPKYDSIPTGWQSVHGPWATLEGDSASHSYGFAQEGKHYFFAGYCAVGILQQDVNVSQYASRIDKQKQPFVVKAYEQSLDQGPNSDQGMISIQALDRSKTKILYSFTSDTARSLSKWRPLYDSFPAPATTRFIRIQLIAVRHVGGDNDGYFDNISLTAIPANSFNTMLVIVVAMIVLLGAGIFALAKKRKRNK